MSNHITLNLTPAQHQRLQTILAMWIEMLNCDPSIVVDEDEELEKIVCTSGNVCHHCHVELIEWVGEYCQECWEKHCGEAWWQIAGVEESE